MLLRNLILNLLFILVISGLPENVLAASDLLLPPEGYTASSTINGSSAEPNKKNNGNSGVVIVNIASGDQNAQANKGAFALNQNGGSAEVKIKIQQTIDNSQLTLLNSSAKAQIAGNSFNNTEGWVAINQASGQANAQINTFAYSQDSRATIEAGLKQTITGDLKTEVSTPIGFSKTDNELGINGKLLADNALQETLSGEQTPVVGGSSRTQHAISVDDTAFKDAQGLVQLNQTAGSGNSSINNFALRVTVDAKL